MLVSDREQKDRLEVCNKCEFKSKDFKLFNVNLFKREPQCKVCKCFINAKVKFDFATCPKQKW